MTTAVAWLGGLDVSLGFATPLWQPGQRAALVVAATSDLSSKYVAELLLDGVV